MNTQANNQTINPTPNARPIGFIVFYSHNANLPPHTFDMAYSRGYANALACDARKGDPICGVLIAQDNNPDALLVAAWIGREETGAAITDTRMIEAWDNLRDATSPYLMD